LKDWERVLGLDLAGSPKRPTGYAFWKDKKLEVGCVYKDEEILSLAQSFELIMIDAPLSLPEDRKDLETPGAHFRECDMELRKAGIKFFPLSLGPMRMLTKRAISLANLLKKQNKRVFETYPGAFYDSVGISRKDKEAIIRFYVSINLNLEERKYLQDELDAVACWLSGVCHTLGKARLFAGKDGQIVLASEECVELLKYTL
jgi:hypothetical protein